MQRVLDIGDRAESIRSELKELFPGTPFEVETRLGVLSGLIVVKWTDGPALTRVKETGIRERHDRVLVDVPMRACQIVVLKRPRLMSGF
jgi:hypothetical protein